MPRAERSIVIGRPIAEVFAFFADAENDPQWRSHVMEIKREGPVGPGARYHQRLKGPGGRSIAADFDVTAFEPDKRWAFQVVTGPARPHGEFLFRTVELGTEVTFMLSAELSGVKGFLLSRPVQKSMDSEVAGLDRAKTILESGEGEP